MHKNTKYACIFTKYAQNFTKYAENGAFTNGTPYFVSPIIGSGRLKPGLHEPQLPVENNVTLVSSIAVERRRCVLLISSVARLQENKET